MRLLVTSKRTSIISQNLTTSSNGKKKAIMTKVEFLKKLFKTENVRCGDCGQMYWVNGRLVWVDTLKGGRISVKLKPFIDIVRAQQYRYILEKNLMSMDYPVDAATKVDIYKCRHYGGFVSGWAVRIKCDKPY